jgi:hypothetical protein
MSTRDNDEEELIAYSFSSASELEIVPAQRSREWMLKTSGSFANRCLPLLMANESGWWLRNRHGFTATWNGGPQRSDIEIEFDEGTPRGAPPSSLFGYGILTWSMPCVFRTPPGVDLLVRGPANLPKDGIAALEGLVESDWIEVPFTVSWKLTRPGLPVRFDEGEPFAMVVPQRRLDLEAYRPAVRSLREAPALVETVKRWLARGERQQLRQFAAEHVEGIGGPEWDGSYLRGETGDGGSFEGHRVRRALRPFAGPDS